MAGSDVAFWCPDLPNAASPQSGRVNDRKILAVGLSHFDRYRKSRVLRSLVKKWLRNFAQGDKWNFCLTAGTLVPANQERP
jgi:hypothetical protein